MPGLLTDVLQVVVKPLEHILHPVKTNHLGKRFTTASTQVGTVVELNRSIGIVVIPLAKQSARLNTCINEAIDGRDGHVRIDVPVMHALDEVDASFVILKHPVKEISLSPIIACDFRAEHVSTDTGARADDVIRAQILIVLFVPVNPVRSVDAVVHDGSSGFGGPVFPHQFFHADESGDGHDGFQIIVLCTKHRCLPRRAAVVRFTDECNSAVRPRLFPEPAHGCVVSKLFGIPHEIHAVVASTGARYRNLSKGVAVGQDLVDEHLAEPATGHFDGRSLHTCFLEVRAAFCNHRDLHAIGDVGEPYGEADEAVGCCPALLNGQRVFNEVMRGIPFILGGQDVVRSNFQGDAKVPVCFVR